MRVVDVTLRDQWLRSRYLGQVPTSAGDGRPLAIENALNHAIEILRWSSLTAHFAGTTRIKMIAADITTDSVRDARSNEHHDFTSHPPGRHNAHQNDCGRYHYR